MKYLKSKDNGSKVIRTEILFTPVLIVIPFIIGFLLINDWYYRGVLEGNSAEFYGEFVIGLIIIFGNILFDIPFIRSLRELSRKNK